MLIIFIIFDYSSLVFWKNKCFRGGIGRHVALKML